MIGEARCELCGEPMPEGEEMFKYHGYSGPCPKPPLPRPEPSREKFNIDKFITDWQWESGDGPSLFHGEYHKQRHALHKFAEALLVAAAPPDADKHEYVTCPDCGKHVRPIHWCNPPDGVSARLAELEKALREYGRHNDECPARFDPRRVGVVTDEKYPCTCGFEAALGEKK